MNGTQQRRRLIDLERQAAALPRAGTVPESVRQFLGSLSNDELTAVEQFCALMLLGHDRIDLLPAERLTDSEALEGWRRLCRHPAKR